MLTGIVITGAAKIAGYPVPPELIPAYSYYDSGRKVKAIIHDVIQKLVIAGCDQIVVGINDWSIEIVNACRSGIEEFSIPLCYTWCKDGDPITVFQEFYPWIQDGAVCIVPGWMTLTPPYLIHRAMRKMEVEGFDSCYVTVGEEGWIAMLNPYAAHELRSHYVEYGPVEFPTVLSKLPTRHWSGDLGIGEATYGVLDQDPIMRSSAILRRSSPAS